MPICFFVRICYNGPNLMYKENPMSNKKRISLLRGLFLALGMLCLLLGVCFDGVQAVIANAIALCMSCIGLG